MISAVPEAIRNADEPHNIRTGTSTEELSQAILDNLYFVQGRIPVNASLNDWYLATAYTVRDRILNRWVTTLHILQEQPIKLVAYLSAEFLLGPHLGNAMINLGITDQVRTAVASLGQDLDAIIEQEGEPGLGNGGLGRLAACYLDSLATLQVAAIGYGIRYEFGIFEQSIRDGWQIERTDKWLRSGNPWEIQRPEIAHNVNLGGHTESWFDAEGRYRSRWIPGKVVVGVACDTPIPGYQGITTDLLRLWKAEAVESFDFDAFNQGDYYGAVHEKLISETISKVLYPNDEPEIGKYLRLAQQYFFVSCSLKDMLKIHQQRGLAIEAFPDTVAIQLNDTHPSIGVAELMRIFVDEHLMGWDEAWELTRRTFAYTNHTLLPEALEKWPLPLFAQLLPRHLEIIYEINRRFLDEVRQRFPGDDARLARMSLIDENGEKHVRMAHLASVGSHRINGVAALHTELLKSGVLRDFHELTPEKFINITNGVTPRRWIAVANPGLATLITERIGGRWLCRMEEGLRTLESHADDPSFRRAWREVKHRNKADLAAVIQERTGIVADPASLFDIQVKRIHEYKRQHLNALHCIALYCRIKRDPAASVVPRTVIFGGKAAPGYHLAKLIIKLITSIAEVVNNDSDVAGRLKIVFFPNFNVKTGQRIYPAADLSEQISTAGKEASGTGNMKFSMNGALTIGTLDGANVEIREEVGAENFFLFGLDAAEVTALKAQGYRPRTYYETDPELREILDLLSDGTFSGGDRELFRPLIDSLLNHDPYLVLADFRAYLDAQAHVERAWQDQEQWTRMSILTTARMGKFSSDRSIREYCEQVWNVTPEMNL